jgi:hypothetical protein
MQKQNNCWIRSFLSGTRSIKGESVLDQGFSVVFLGPKANAELVPKFHVALHASHAALPMVTLKISPCTNVTLTSDFDIGLDHSVHGGYG